MARENHLSHQLDQSGLAKVNDIRRKVIELDALFSELVPSGNDLELALMFLNSARMYAISGISASYSVVEIE